MDTDIKALNALLGDKLSCVKETYGNSDLTNLIIKLDTDGYTFTRPQFDAFVIAATFKKGNSYLINHYLNIEARKKAITILFSKFIPTEKQFKLLFDCYKSNNTYKSYTWVDALLKNPAFAFTEQQLTILKNTTYDMANIHGNRNLTADDIKAMVQKRLCQHQSCASLLPIIEANNIVYPPTFITGLIDFLTSIYNRNYYYKDLLDIFLVKLKLPFDDNSYKSICKFGSCEFALYCLKNGFIPTTEFVELCLKSPEYNTLYFYLHNNTKVKITTEIMNGLLLRSNYFGASGIYSASKVTPILLSYGYSQEIITQATISSQTRNYGDCISTYKLCELLNIKPNNETFKVAIKMDNTYAIQQCIQTYKMIPTNEHLKAGFSSGTFTLETMSEFFNYKIFLTKEDYNTFMNGPRYNDKPMLETLIKHGLKLDLEDIELALSKKVAIDNLERFNIPYDETLYFLCYIHNFYPYDAFMTIDPELLEIRQICRKTLSFDLASAMADKPGAYDKYCFDHLCSLKNYYTYRQSLLDACLPTMTMFYWDSQNSNTVHFKKYLQAHNITKETMMEKLIPLSKN